MDWYGKIHFSNPGSLKLPVQDIYEGGHSVARNPHIQTFFRMIGVGDNIGSGFPTILSAWGEENWRKPDLSEDVDLHLVELKLWMISLMPQECTDYLLEHLSENRDKEQDILCVLDKLVNYVESSSLPPEKKDSLKNFLNTGRKVSANQKCIALCERYAKPSYGGYTCKKIIGEAYSIRSAFSHGDNCDNRYSECAAYIKLVVLDVIKNYMREKENIRTQ